jgi:hypothetical protein
MFIGNNPLNIKVLNVHYLWTTLNLSKQNKHMEKPKIKFLIYPLIHRLNIL